MTPTESSPSALSDLPEPSLWQALREELTLSPERTTAILRITGLCVLVAILSMALRVPEAAISAYMVFFVTKEDAGTTALTGAVLIVAAAIAIGLSFVFYSLSLGEPALRLPLMALLTFGGMFFSRVSPAGPIAFAIGFVTTLALTLVDVMPIPEVLVRGLLWIWVAASYPTALVVLANLAFARRPAELFTSGVVLRLQVAAGLLGATKGADGKERADLRRLARAGVAELAKYANAGPKATAVTRGALLSQVDRILTLLCELPAEDATNATVRAALEEIGRRLLASEQALRSSKPPPARFSPLVVERGVQNDASTAMWSILLELSNASEALALSLAELAADVHSPKSAEKKPPVRLLVDDAFTNPDHVRFALKSTLAAMLAYLIYTALSWSGIRTAMITCFFVAMGSLGETIHKLTLRIVGAVVGGGLGLLAIIFVVPRLDSVVGLAILIAVGTLPAAVLATGSPRIAYAGWQLAIAYFLCVLQGFSPSSNMVVARDRVIGILLGNAIMTVVFSSIWPVKVRSAVAKSLSEAVSTLREMLLLEKRSPVDPLGSPADHLRLRFHRSIADARRYAPLERFEPGRRGPSSQLRIDTTLVTLVESLLVPVARIAQHPQGDPLAAPSEALEAAELLKEAIVDWFSSLSDVLCRGDRSSLRAPPDITAIEACLKDDMLGTRLCLGEHERFRLAYYRLLGSEVERLSAAVKG